MARLKWYTRARKFPQLIGRTPDGTRIPGGPYTFLQVGAGAAVVAVMTQTTWLWARGDMISNVVVLVAVFAGTVFFTGKLPPGARSPMFLIAGVSRLLSRGQRLNDRPIRLPRMRWVAEASVDLSVAGAPESVPDDIRSGAEIVVLAPPAPPLSAVQKLLAGGTS